MKWSNELPKVAGHYWIRPTAGNAFIRELWFRDGEPHFENQATGRWLALKDLKGWQFSGPIPEPQAE